MSLPLLILFPYRWLQIIESSSPGSLLIINLLYSIDIIVYILISKSGLSLHYQLSLLVPQVWFLSQYICFCIVNKFIDIIIKIPQVRSYDICHSPSDLLSMIIARFIPVAANGIYSFLRLSSIKSVEVAHLYPLIS